MLQRQSCGPHNGWPAAQARRLGHLGGRSRVRGTTTERSRESGQDAGSHINAGHCVPKPGHRDVCAMHFRWEQLIAVRRDRHRLHRHHVARNRLAQPMSSTKAVNHSSRTPRQPLSADAQRCRQLDGARRGGSSILVRDAGRDNRELGESNIDDAGRPRSRDTALQAICFQQTSL
jgi:hypothetical protein